MVIAVSADCFSSFTSGFPVRGMMLELIKLCKDDKFVLFYTNRPKPQKLGNFYNEIEHLPNVEVRYFKYSRRIVALRRMLGLSLIDKTNEFSLFLNPGCPEVWSNLNIPHICSIADFSTLKGLSTGKYAWFYKWFNRYALKRSFQKITTIVPISYFTENDIYKFWPNLKVNTNVVHNGIDDMWFDDRVDECCCNPFNKEPYFIWWGLISRRKNIEKLILAYKKAKSENPEIPNLLLVGDVEGYMEHIKTMLDENIANIPFQSNYVLKGLVKNSQGLIFPSLYEGFGLPIVEAFSQGLPVACSNVSSLPEIANGFALMFDPNDVCEIRQQILTLAHYQVDINAIKTYSHQFTYKKAAEAYSLILNNFTI